MITFLTQFFTSSKIFFFKGSKDECVVSSFPTTVTKYFDSCKKNKFYRHFFLLFYSHHKDFSTCKIAKTVEFLSSKLYRFI